MPVIAHLLVVNTIVLLAATANAAEPAARISPGQVDQLIVNSLSDTDAQAVVDDEQFLRRLSLDLIGRQPTPEESTRFAADENPDRRAAAIDQLLDSEEFGTHWAHYWRDTISARVPPPELTFLNYDLFHQWLAAELNANHSWAEITRAILTGTGPIKENPAATFVGYHQGNAVKLGAETARVFLGLQLQCAECHDHPFDDWQREEFHQMAAFFARAAGELGKVQDGTGTIVSDRGKGEYRMPNALDVKKPGTAMLPTLMTGEGLPLGKPDMARRQRLANLITLPDNPWFAQAYVNRIWAKLMGRGFYEPVDDMGPYKDHLLPEVHEALTAHFLATGYDIKDLFRIILATDAYQRRLPNAQSDDNLLAAGTTAERLRGDVLYDALFMATGLPNVKGEQAPATKAFRFPPPPKSTRELVVEAFAADPSLPEEEQPRTMGQAMFLMNNTQLQAQINAAPESGTQLSQLLIAYPKNRAAIEQLFLQVLARQPTERETTIAAKHIQKVGNRNAAFEDLLWGLVNTVEFTTR